PVRQPVLPARGRPAGDANALAARLPGKADAGRRDPAGHHGPRRRDPAGVLHPAGHDARHVHDLLRDHAAAGGGVRELPDPAQNRDARHGVPAHQYVVILVVLRGRPGDVVELVRTGWRIPGWMDAVRAALGAPRFLGRLVWTGVVVGLDHFRRAVVHLGVVELHHHDHQQPRTWHDVVPPAALGVVAVHHGHPGAARVAGPLRRGDHAAVRPDHRHALLRPGRRRPGALVAAPVLVLRASRGLHPDPAGHGDGL